MPGFDSGKAGCEDALGMAARSTPGDSPIFRLRNDIATVEEKLGIVQK